MTTITLQAPAKRHYSGAREPNPMQRGNAKQSKRHTTKYIEGRYRAVPAIQLASAWWLYQEGHMTRRALRCYFAAHEMAERRRYAKDKKAAERPVFRIDELAALVGGKDSPSALRALTGDVRALAALGLVTIEAHKIKFARELDLSSIPGAYPSSLRAFLGHMPSTSRTVPMPRRLLRALAAGFGKAETAYVIAAMLRSVFWKKEQGVFTVDGRMKGSWVALAFGLSRRAVSAARAHLIDIGWLEPLQVHQMMANLYGVHDVVNVHWSPDAAIDTDEDREALASSDQPTEPSTEIVDNPATDPVGEGRGAGGSASPMADFAGGFASPRNKKTLSTKDSYTRKLSGPRAARSPDDGSGFGGRKKKGKGARASSEQPNIRDVQPGDLGDTDRLMELHAQAVALGLAHRGGAGTLDFLSLANRARVRGKNPGGLFMWLLRERKTDFITLADEEVAAKRVREMHSGPTIRSSGGGERVFHQAAPDYTEDENLVLRCQKRCPGRSPEELFRTARRHLPEGWGLDRWMGAHLSLRQKDAQRWADVEDDCLVAGGYSAGAGW